jgi:hypothetical protein
MIALVIKNIKLKRRIILRLKILEVKTEMGWKIIKKNLKKNYRPETLNIGRMDFSYYNL